MLQQQLPLHLQLQLQLHYNYNCNHNYNCTYDLQLHYNYKYNYNYIALRYTTLHPAVVGEVTTATTPKAQPPFGPSVGSLCHPCVTTHLSYSFLSFETSATALCGTTGKMYYLLTTNH